MENSTYQYEPENCPNDGQMLHMALGKKEYRCPECGAYLSTSSSRVVGMIDDYHLQGRLRELNCQPAEHPCQD